MKNFFLYYNKNNHILSSELIFDNGTLEWVSKPIDEPFFVIGIYLNNVKYTSTDLTSYEQSICISDYNDLKNIQPNYYRDSHTPLRFKASNLLNSSSLSSFLQTKFAHPTIVNKDSKYCFGTQIYIKLNLLDHSVTEFLVDDEPSDNLSYNIAEIDSNVTYLTIGGLNIGMYQKCSRVLEIIYFPLTNVLHFGYETELGVEQKVNVNGYTYMQITNLGDMTTTSLYYADTKLKHSEII